MKKMLRLLKNDRNDSNFIQELLKPKKVSINKVNEKAFSFKLFFEKQKSISE